MAHIATDERHPQYLEPSELGTREYWETFYTRSLEHIASKKSKTADGQELEEQIDRDKQGDHNAGDDDDDPGTSWFSEHDAPRKILRFLTSRKFPLSPRNSNANANPSILDLGTGNGSMLALLRKRGGFRGVMVGVDYSAQSVQLARELQRLKLHSAYESGGDTDEEEEDEDDDDENENEDEHEDVVVATTTTTTTSASMANGSNDNTVVHAEEAIPLQEQDIRFEEWDILDPANEDILSLGKEEEEEDTHKRLPWFPYQTRGFDIVLDKGTFDAISLSDETQHGATTTTTTTTTTHICHKYPVIATRLVRPGGYLVVTSCNWTEDELVKWFTTSSSGGGDAELEVWHRLEYPRFRFGGQEGQGVCTVCFRRRD